MKKYIVTGCEKNQCKNKKQIKSHSMYWCIGTVCTDICTEVFDGANNIHSHKIKRFIMLSFIYVWCYYNKATNNADDKFIATHDTSCALATFFKYMYIYKINFCGESMPFFLITLSTLSCACVSLFPYTYLNDVCQYKPTNSSKLNLYANTENRLLCVYTIKNERRKHDQMKKITKKNRAKRIPIISIRFALLIYWFIGCVP